MRLLYVTCDLFLVLNVLGQALHVAAGAGGGILAQGQGESAGWPIVLP